MGKKENNKVTLEKVSKSFNTVCGFVGRDLKTPKTSSDVEEASTTIHRVTVIDRL